MANSSDRPPIATVNVHFTLKAPIEQDHKLLEFVEVIQMNLRSKEKQGDLIVESYRMDYRTDNTFEATEEFTKEELGKAIDKLKSETKE